MRIELTPEESADAYRVLRSLARTCADYPSSFECYGDLTPEDMMAIARRIVTAHEGAEAARFDLDRDD